MAYGWGKREPTSAERHDKTQRLINLAYIVGVPLVLLIGLGWWVASSAMEAAAYNRATGSNVSTWDAMWIELRVQAGPKAHD